MSDKTSKELRDLCLKQGLVNKLLYDESYKLKYAQDYEVKRYMSLLLKGNKDKLLEIADYFGGIVIDMTILYKSYIYQDALENCIFIHKLLNDNDKVLEINKYVDGKIEFEKKHNLFGLVSMPKTLTKQVKEKEVKSKSIEIDDITNIV